MLVDVYLRFLKNSRSFFWRTYSKPYFFF